MKKARRLPFLALLLFVLIVSTACGFSLGKNNDATEEPRVIVVTATPERQAPTEAPVPFLLMSLTTIWIITVGSIWAVVMKKTK